MGELQRDLEGDPGEWLPDVSGCPYIRPRHQDVPPITRRYVSHLLQKGKEKCQKIFARIAICGQQIPLRSLKMSSHVSQHHVITLSWKHEHPPIFCALSEFDYFTMNFIWISPEFRWNLSILIEAKIWIQASEFRFCYEFGFSLKSCWETQNFIAVALSLAAGVSFKNMRCGWWEKRENKEKKMGEVENIEYSWRYFVECGSILWD